MTLGTRSPDSFCMGQELLEAVVRRYGPSVRQKLFGCLVGSVVSSHALAFDERPPTHFEPGTREARGLSGEVVALEDSSSTDGVYGRLDGDLTLSLGLGSLVPLEGAPASASAAAKLHYYWSLGVYARYSDTLRDVPDDSARRELSTGIELRPLFLLRWPLDLEAGPAWLDLLVDSLRASAGVLFAETEGADSALLRSGARASFGLGAGFPLMQRAEGLWLEAEATFQTPSAPDAEFALLLELAWHAPFESPWLTP